MKKIKVLQVNKMYYPEIGGIEKVTQQVAEGLKDRTDMEVLVCNRKGKSMSEDINGVKVVRASSFGIYFSMPVSISFIYFLRKMSKEKDVILFHMPFPLGDLAEVLSGYKGKVVVWWHSDIVKQKHLLKLYEPLMKKFLKRADTIIVATDGHVKYSNYLNEFKEKCVVIPYGVSDSLINDANRYISKNNRYEENEDAEVKFLFVGRLVYYKGCDILLKAFSRLNCGHLIIAGDGVLKEKLYDMVKELKINDRVEFISNPDNKTVMELYKNCDVFVLPSIEKTEAFGLVQIEAMAYGKPVINTNLKSGVPYVGENGKTCITVEQKNEEALYNAMKQMIDNPEKRKIMGKNARMLVENRYLVDDMINKVYGVLS